MLGPTSWIANGFLTKVTETDSVDTFAISGNGELFYNPEFKKKWITNENKLQEVLLHEIMHKIYNDFLRTNDHWTNLGADVVINATVNQMLGHCELMQDFYKDDSSQESFLCPTHDSPFQTPLYNLWTLLRNTYNVETEISNQEVIDALRGHFEDPNRSKKDKKKPKLLGNHGQPGENPNGGAGDCEEEGEDGEGVTPLTREDLNRISEDLQKAPSAGGKIAGVGGVLGGIFTKAIKSNLTIKSRVFRDFAMDNNMGKVKSYFTTTRRTSAVFPTNPSRANLLMVAAGQCPTIWRNEVRSESSANKGLAVYIDVSGSMNSVLPKICGMLDNMRSYLTDIYQFSNMVHRSSLAELAAGKLHSTGGTDFNCVIDNAVAKSESKIVIITDGYADADDERRKKALSTIKKAMVILVGRYDNSDNWFSKTYKSQTYQLGDLVR